MSDLDPVAVFNPLDDGIGAGEADADAGGELSSKGGPSQHGARPQAGSACVAAATWLACQHFASCCSSRF